MIAYKSPTWRPMRPLIGQPVVVPTAAPAASVVPAGAPVPEGLFWTAVAAAAAYAGIRTGMRGNESNFTRAAGWIGGVGAGLAALVGLTGILSPTTARTLPFRWYWVA